MGKVYESIDEKVQQFIESQQLFFVATAPLSDTGHVNVSPKGLESLKILDGRTIVYADLAGSGIETVAHVRENGRIVLMFCAFAGAPQIVRLRGRGEVIEPHHSDFTQLRPEFSDLTGLRSFIRVRCTRISDSCGFGVPLFDFVGQRDQLIQWSRKKGADGVREYLQQKNVTSVDGLPGVTSEESP